MTTEETKTAPAEILEKGGSGDTTKIIPDEKKEKKEGLEEEGTTDTAETPLVAGDKDKEGKEKEATKEKDPPPPPPPKVYKQDFEKDVVYLYQFGRTSVLPSLSPFCLKVETWLRLNDIKYENMDHKSKHKSSKGQLPFVELNGEEIADSAVILAKLSQHFGVDPDAQLTKEEKNLSHALSSMIENHIFWIFTYWRSKNPDGLIKGAKLNLQNVLNSKFPKMVLNVVFKLTYIRSAGRKVKAQGLGVHSGEEILEFGKQDLSVLEESLGGKQFFFGDKPSNLDIIAFANLSQIAYIDKSVDYELRDWMAENCPGLMALLTRVKERCYPDWDEMTKTLGMNTHIPVPPPEEKKDDEKEKESKDTEKEPIKEEIKEKEGVKEEEKK